MNISLRCLIIISFSLGWVAPLFSTTWYSQSSGNWGDTTPTPGLWNTDPGGTGTPMDGDLVPTAADDIVIQQTHVITIADFSSQANLLELHTLTVANDAVLNGSPTMMFSMHGSTITVNGAINFPTLTIESAAPAELTLFTGSGSASLENIHAIFSPTNNNISIDLDISLSSSFYPFFAHTSSAPSKLVIEKTKTLNVNGAIFMDRDAINNFTLNNVEFASTIAVEGTLIASGNLQIFSNNFVEDLQVAVAAGALLQLGGAITGGVAPFASTSIIDIDGTLAIAATDPFQGMSNVYQVRMNTGSLCRFTGGANQLLDADVNQNIFHNVELAGSGPKVLSGNLRISNEITMGTMLQLGNFDLNLIKQFTSTFFGNTGYPILSYSATAFMETNGTGGLILYVPVGTSNVEFPIGSGNYTRNIITHNPSSAGGATVGGYMKMRVENGVNPSGPASTINYVSKTWYLEDISSFNPSVNIQFYWHASNEQSNFDINACWPSFYTGSNWDVATPIVATFRQISRSDVTTFGAFTIASDGLLPVELISFDATAKPSGHLLEWSTASELNNSHFEIEHSLNGAKFSKIGEVSGKGTIQEEQAYTWLHLPKNRQSTHYYRLKQVDFDGQYAYSDIVALENTVSDKITFQVYPTLVSDQVHIRIPTQHLLINQMYVFSVDGRQSWQYPVATGDQIDLSVSDLPSGIYAVSGLGSDGTTHQMGRFVKQ